MLTRYKWLSISRPSDFSVSRLGAFLGGEAYSDEKGWGVSISELRRSELTGVFVERVERSALVVDPFGKEEVVRWSEYKRATFRVSTSYPEIELLNPSGLSRSFIGKLRDMPGSAIAKSIDVDPIAWLGALEKRVGRLVANSIRAVDITVTATTHSSVLVMGSTDVRASLKAMLSGRASHVDKVEVTWADQESTLELHSDGSANFSKPCGAQALRHVRDALEDAQAISN